MLKRMEDKRDVLTQSLAKTLQARKPTGRRNWFFHIARFIVTVIGVAIATRHFFFNQIPDFGHDKADKAFENTHDVFLSVFAVAEAIVVITLGMVIIQILVLFVPE